MAKGAIAKLGKLKCIVKRWHSRSSSSSNTNHGKSNATAADVGCGGSTGAPINAGSCAAGNKVEPVDLHPVYVGSSRRRYLISSHLMHHPLLRALLHDGEEEEASPTVVGCEVVLFDHLLWMLENADQPESLDDLVDFYSC